MPCLRPSRLTRSQESPSFRQSLNSPSVPRILRPSNQLVSICLTVTGVMALLRPLLLDNVPSIQQSAALALGRLANYSDELAEAVVSNEILPQLVYSLSEQNVRPLQ